jgi:hypothetical protein
MLICVRFLCAGDDESQEPESQVDGRKLSPGRCNFPWSEKPHNLAASSRCYKSSCCVYYSAICSFESHEEKGFLCWWSLLGWWCWCGGWYFMQQAENKKHMDPQRMANRKQREAAPTQPKAPEMPVRRALHNQTLDLNCVIAMLFYHGSRMLACLLVYHFFSRSFWPLGGAALWLK